MLLVVSGVLGVVAVRPGDPCDERADKQPLLTSTVEADEEGALVATLHADDDITIVCYWDDSGDRTEHVVRGIATGGLSPLDGTDVAVHHGGRTLVVDRGVVGQVHGQVSENVEAVSVRLTDGQRIEAELREGIFLAVWSDDAWISRLEALDVEGQVIASDEPAEGADG